MASNVDKLLCLLVLKMSGALAKEQSGAIVLTAKNCEVIEPTLSIIHSLLIYIFKYGLR